MLRTDTQGAMLDALQAVHQYINNESDRPWKSVEALCVNALSLVDRDEKKPRKMKRRRPLTELARGVLDLLRDEEWVLADTLVGATHRFGDAVYILRQNGYIITRRKKPKVCHEYKLVRGPGWPGWVNGKSALQPKLRRKAAKSAEENQ